MDLNYPSEQTNETLISAENIESQILNHKTVKNTNLTEDKHIILTIGPEELKDSDAPFEITYPGSMRSRLITKNKKFALRTHLQELETHNILEKEAIQCINRINKNINISNLNNLSQKERATNFINHVKYLYNRYDVKSHMLFIKNGNWRNKNTSQEITTKAYDILNEEDRNTQACYKTAFLSCMALREKTDIDNERISYCEGIAIPKYGGLPNQHAWVEIDNEVIELTWPWSGPIPTKTSLYYGIEINWDTVYHKMINRPTYASVLMSDNEYYSHHSVIKAIQQNKKQ